MIFLGTSAAEMIPDPFCGCDVCNYARKHPEEQRVRSSFMIDNNTLIDIGPDVFASSMKFGVNLNSLKNILITHTHEDHFCIDNLNIISCNIPKPKNMFTIHLSPEGYEFVASMTKVMKEINQNPMSCVDNGFYNYEVHKPFEEFRMDNKTVFPVVGFHTGRGKNEKSFNYRIKDEKGTLLYALDTGVYPEETIEALSGVPVDILIMDATFGSCRMDSGCTHLDAYTFVSQLERLVKVGTVTSKTRIFASHINHYNQWKHNEYEKFLKDSCPGLNITVARDGMVI